MQTLIPEVNNAILANLRQQIRDREVKLGRHGCHNTNSHLKHLNVTLLSEIDDELLLWEYLGHLREVSDETM
jgi:hypothetical protein